MLGVTRIARSASLGQLVPAAPPTSNKLTATTVIINLAWVGALAWMTWGVHRRLR